MWTITTVSYQRQTNLATWWRTGTLSLVWLTALLMNEGIQVSPQDRWLRVRLRENIQHVDFSTCVSLLNGRRPITSRGSSSGSSASRCPVMRRSALSPHCRVTVLLGNPPLKHTLCCSQLPLPPLILRSIFGFQVQHCAVVQHRQ